jgi:hypothetical protein
MPKSVSELFDSYHAADAAVETAKKALEDATRLRSDAVFDILETTKKKAFKYKGNTRLSAAKTSRPVQLPTFSRAKTAQN